MSMLALLVAFQSLQPRRSIPSCSPSLMAPILEHPAIPALSIDIRPRSRLKPKHKHLFDRTNRTDDDDDSTLLFDELALVACSTGVVCRKELLETYAAATFIHAKFPHMKRFADLAAGHGLLSWFLLALDHHTDDDDKNTDDCINRRPRTVVCVDRRMPPSADAIAAAMIKRFPELESRWSYIQADLSTVVSHPSCVLTSVHACGTLSDYLIEMAIGMHDTDTDTSATGTCMSNSSPLAIVPCCHTVQERKGYRPHLLSGMDAEEVATLVEERKKKQDNLKHEAVGDVVDEVRCRTLRNAWYDVETAMLPEAFTARNRMLLAIPKERPITESAGGADADAGKRVGAHTFFQRQAPSPLIRIPLGDDPESIAHCHAISGRDRATTRLQQQIPKHFSPSLVMSIWLTTSTSADMGGGRGSSFDDNSVLTVETLQAFANQCCEEIEIEAEDDNQIPQIRVQCTVEVFGEVNVQSTTGRCSQRYRFTYSSRRVNLSIAGISRTIAKRIDGAIRERVVDNFGDMLR